jgi:hypothetical protein
MTSPSISGSAGERPVPEPGPGTARPAGPGVPLSVWAGLPAPDCAPPGQSCGPVTTAVAARVTGSFSRPGDLVVAVDGSPAAAEAAACAGRLVLSLAPGGPARLLAAGGPGAGTAALVIVGCPGPEPDGGGLLYAACERVLRPGGVLAVITPGPGGDGPPGDLDGQVVAAARAAGLGYAQHVVLVHAAVDGDRLDPAGPASGTASPPGGTRVHSDLLVFTKPGKPVSSAELKDSQPELPGGSRRSPAADPWVHGEDGDPVS